MNSQDKEYVVNVVSKALDYQFEGYTWNDMINDLDLTKEEKAFALNHIGYKAYIL